MFRFHLFKSNKLHTYLIFKFWYTNIDSTLLSQTIVCQTMFGKVVVGERLPTLKQISFVHPRTEKARSCIKNNDYEILL